MPCVHALCEFLEMPVRMPVCPCAPARTLCDTCLRACACVHAYVRLHACVYACVHACVHKCLRARPRQAITIYGAIAVVSTAPPPAPIGTVTTIHAATYLFTDVRVGA